MNANRHSLDPVSSAWKPSIFMNRIPIATLYTLSPLASISMLVAPLDPRIKMSHQRSRCSFISLPLPQLFL